MTGEWLGHWFSWSKFHFLFSDLPYFFWWPLSPNTVCSWWYVAVTGFCNRVPAETCFSFSGRLVRAVVGQGQKMVIKGDINGCLDSVRQVMKYFVHSLGIRNEYNRPDRGSYLKVFPGNISDGNFDTWCNHVTVECIFWAVIRFSSHWLWRKKFEFCFCRTG